MGILVEIPIGSPLVNDIYLFEIGGNVYTCQRISDYKLFVHTLDPIPAPGVEITRDGIIFDTVKTALDSYNPDNDPALREDDGVELNADALNAFWDDENIPIIHLRLRGRD